MPANSETNLKKVIDHFTPEVLGVFWITNEELNRDLLGFDEFNYLFDGLISQYLYGQRDQEEEKHLERSNVFFTKNFNQKIFLAHLKTHDSIAGVIDDQIALIHENNSDVRKKILLFNQTSTNWLNDLAKRYPQFEFIEFDFGVQ